MTKHSIHRVDSEGRINRIGSLTPVRDEVFVIELDSGETLHSEGLPWWLLDMRPQGFMGRAYVGIYADKLGLPTSLTDWTDTHAVRALLAHGHDVTGNLLLGDAARDRFLEAPASEPIALDHRAAAYTELGGNLLGSDQSWSPAGGEQPKFTAYAETQEGPRHVIVKFSVDADNEGSQRWRDLLLCEHHALEALSAAGVPVARTEILDAGRQRFLQVERFDRVGLRGRRGLVSLSAVDNEFAGLARKAWPEVTRTLATDGHITQAAYRGATLLYAYGCLIGNTDMHHGNLAFLNTNGRPYELAPAFDMLPMAFQPRTGGQIVNAVNPVALLAEVPADAWRLAMSMARNFLARIQAEERLSQAFFPCQSALEAHLDTMQSEFKSLA